MGFFDSLAEAQNQADARKLEKAARQQDRRAAVMSSKWGRGNRRAAKAADRAVTLHEQAATKRGRFS